MEPVLAALARALEAAPPFYRHRFAQAGLDNVLDPAAFARLPLTRRADLLRDQLEHLPHGTRRSADAPPPVRVGATGSGADLLLLAWSAADLARERRAGARLLGRLGVGRDTRVANTLPGALATPGSLLLGDVVEELGGLDVPLGDVSDKATARAAWELVDRVEPAVLVLEPASAAGFLAAAPAARRPWWRGIVRLGRGGCAPTIAAPGFTGWQRTWLAVPEATSFVAASCLAGRLHADTELVAEVVHDATGAAQPPGHDGVLALTPLGFEAHLLRYATGLAARLPPEPCGCGEPGLTFEVR